MALVNTTVKPFRPPPSSTASSSRRPRRTSRASGPSSSSTRPTSPSSARPSWRPRRPLRRAARRSGSRCTRSRPTRTSPTRRGTRAPRRSARSSTRCRRPDPPSKQLQGPAKGQGLADRGTFLVDPDGVIQFNEVTAEGIGRNAAELVRKVKAAITCATTRARSAPPSGKRARTPSPRRSTSWARSDSTGLDPGSRTAALVGADLTKVSEPVEQDAVRPRRLDRKSAKGSLDLLGGRVAVRRAGHPRAAARDDDPASFVPRRGAPAPRSRWSSPGLPLGHEFTSLVLALLQVGGHPRPPRPSCWMPCAASR